MKYYDDYSRIASQYPSSMIRDSILFNDRRILPAPEIPEEFRYAHTVEPRDSFFIRLKRFIKAKLLKR